MCLPCASFALCQLLDLFDALCKEASTTSISTKRSFEVACESGNIQRLSLHCGDVLEFFLGSTWKLQKIQKNRTFFPYNKTVPTYVG